MSPTEGACGRITIKRVVSAHRRDFLPNSRLALEKFQWMSGLVGHRIHAQKFWKVPAGPRVHPRALRKSSALFI